MVNSLVKKEDNNIKENEKVTPKANMLTVDKTKAENFLIAIEEAVGNVEELKEIVDTLIQNKDAELQNFQNTTIEKFNALIISTKDLAEKIKATESYENFLAEKVENANLSKSVALLEQQLQKEKAEISSFIIKIDDFIQTKFFNFESTINEFKSVNDLLENCLQSFKNEIQAEVKKSLNNVENKMNEASDSYINGAKVQYESLTSKSNTLIKAYTEKCQECLETIKKQSIDFLKQCQSENRKLIEKVPAVAERKICTKDLIIIILSLCSLASFIKQFFL